MYHSSMVEQPCCFYIFAKLVEFVAGMLIGQLIGRD